MSGIAGIVGNVEGLEYQLAAMMRSQQHRGDAGCGFWVSSFFDELLGLACCNRTVSEVEEPVRQPYVDEETRLVVMADCDISNYRELKTELQTRYNFVTDSSIEVISKAYRMWGVDFLLRLKGAFVIVIYDKLQDVLLVARDRFGVKPLYYTTHRGSFCFASEVRPVFQSGVQVSVSVERCAGYLLYSTYGADYETFWENIYQLPAGSLLEYNGCSLLEKRWYNLHDDVVEWIERCGEKPMSDHLVEVLELCAEHSLFDVSCCGLRVATRIESQLLHSMVFRGQYGWKVHAFTGDIDNMGHQPEATPVWLTECEVVKELEGMSQWIEEPFDGRETLLRTAMFRRARHDGVRLLCSGLGLDAMWQEFWDVSGVKYNYRVAQSQSLFSPDLTLLATRPRPVRYFSDDMENNRYCDLCHERMPHILRFFDRSAAEAGISLRMPFLDGDLVALSFVLPLLLRRERSAVFRDMVFQHHNYKTDRRGAELQRPMWMRGIVKEWLDDVMVDLCCGALREWFDIKSMENMREMLNKNGQYDELLLWKCVSLHRMLGAGKELKNEV